MAADLIYQSGWRHNRRGPFVPVYRYGPAPDKYYARKPEKLNQLERSRKWKEKSGYNEFRKAERRIAKPADPVLAALMGMGR